MGNKILVTGATGNVGSQLIRHLRQAGSAVVAAVRSREGRTDEEDLEYREFDFTDPASWAPCLEGVSRVFLMRPPHISNIRRDMYPFMRYLKEREIRQVVFLSVQGAENNRFVPHHKVEQACTSLDLPCTFLRPSFFMQNLTTTHLPEIRDRKMLFVPAGEGRTNFIDVRDIAEIAAKVLQDDSHIRKAYTITGEKSYSHGEIADHLSRILGENITFKNPGPLSFLSYHLKNGRKAGMALVMLALYSVVKLGKGDITSDTSEKILGRKTLSLEQFIIDHRNLFLGGTPS